MTRKIVKRSIYSNSNNFLKTTSSIVKKLSDKGLLKAIA